MIGYAFAAPHLGRVTRFVLMDARLPGVGTGDEIVCSRAQWHFSFQGLDAEQLVAGRERIYLDRFCNEVSADPRSFDEASRKHYAKLYARPGAMHAGFNQFAAFDQDAIGNKAFTKSKLTVPLLPVGGEKSFGSTMAVVIRATVFEVTELVIPNSGHWLMEEQRAATIAAVRALVDRKS
jgi:pimeloyl-ACP methyl ester carboxylesterase